MKHSGLEPAYEAARTWALHPGGRTPPGWAQIVRRGIATWMREPHPLMPSPSPLPQPARLGSSKLLTILAAMIAEVCP
jgi:hypothetical protein